jgi:hypothetical protein
MRQFAGIHAFIWSHQTLQVQIGNKTQQLKQAELLLRLNRESLDANVYQANYPLMIALQKWQSFEKQSQHILRIY